MTLAAEQESSLRDLIDALCEGELNADALARLESLLLTDDAACRYYLGYVKLHGLMLLGSRPAENIAAVVNVPQAEPVPDAGVPHAAAPMPLLGSLGNAWHRTGSFLSDHEYFTGNLVATLFFAVAALIGSNVYVSTPEYSQYFTQHARGRDDSPQSAQGHPREEAVPEEEAVVSVAQITGKVDCVWADITTAPAWHKIKVNDKFELKSGLMEITYYSGAKVILQGPCTYEVDSAVGGNLSLGKLTARVEKKGAGDAGRGTGEEAVTSGQWPVASESTGEAVDSGVWRVASESTESRNPQIPKSQNPSSLATSHYPLFTVKTPTAIVTDLGTEFGVDVNKNGETSTDVFRGSVRLAAIGADGQAVGQGVLLCVNESACVKNTPGRDENVIVRQSEQVNPQKFVRRMIQEIDLLDIVAGGNGTGRRRERGIDPTTCFEDPQFVSKFRSGDDGSYHRSFYNPLIDGVFVPRGGRNPVPLDSAGHVFDLPGMSGHVFGSIWARSAEVKPDQYANNKNYWVYAMGQGKQFMPKGAGLLCMHSNAGITFNLETMRKMIRDARPVRFRATLGMGDATPYDAVGGPKALADVWIFVDGQLKYKNMQIRPEADAAPVAVEIGPEDHFLTIVVTEGGNGINCDWVVFGDPRLEMIAETKDANGN